MEMMEEVYKYNEYKILDVSWSQFSESTTDQTRTIFRGRKASSGFQRMVKSQEKLIAIIHYAHHWSFTVIDPRERKLQTYDSMTKGGHKKANEKLQNSIEEILGEEQQNRWRIELVKVPQQSDRVSCGYRMIYNLDRICSGKDIEPIENEDFAFEGYMLEIVTMLKKKQQGRVNRKKAAEENIKRKEGKRKKRKDNLEEESGGKEIEQELRKREEEMDKRIAEETKKRKEREEKEEEDKRTKKLKTTTTKRTREQQEQEYPEEKQEEGKLRSGKNKEK